MSHVPLVEKARGHTYARPVATMRAYLDAIGREGPALDDPDRPVAIAALGPRMLALAAERCRGALPYNVTPEHTASARAALGPDRWLVVEQKVCLQRDPAEARALARKELARYMTLDNYRNNWFRIGFATDDMENGGSDRFMDAMVAWGSAEDIAGRLRAHLDAGADQVVIQPVHGSGAPAVDWNAVEAVSAAMGTNGG